jgi:putative ABC transport system substrate-binding protein
VRRRAFITLVGGAAAWPAAARAQQGERNRRVAVFTALAPDDPENQSRIAAFQQEMQRLGWTEGQNLRITYHSVGSDAEHVRKEAAELVTLAPDVILANGGTTMVPLHQLNRSVAVVFVNVPDPVGAGFVASLARPGGNATGFTVYEYGISGKWLELLKQVAPGVARVAVLRDPANPSGMGQWGVIQAVSPSFGVELRPVDNRNADEIERGITTFAQEPNGGMIVVANAFSVVHRDLIIRLAARHRLPAVYPYRFFCIGGGLIAYGVDDIDQYRRAAGYVDRVLRGARPADLPVQGSSKYQLTVNLAAAKALGLEIPPTLLARADGVIEQRCFAVVR